MASAQLIHLLNNVPPVSQPNTTLQPIHKSTGIAPFYKKKTHLSEWGQMARDTTLNTLRDLKKDCILDNEDLDLLWTSLTQVSRPYSEEDSQKLISYQEFKNLEKELPPKFKPFLKASIYARFSREPNTGCISILEYFNYVLRRVSLLQARLDLSLYDSDNDGVLTEEELQNYILDLMPLLHLSALNPSFHKFYICTAVRKFMFFLDSLKRGKVSIQSILLSPILTEMFELRDMNLPKDVEKTNWFSSHSSLKIYSQFLALDKDHNGMLSKDELLGYNGGTLTSFFVERVFQECQTFGGEMTGQDFKAFLDFVLAMENLSTKESIVYCFKLLDFQGKRYLDEFCIKHFVRAVSERMGVFGLEPVPIEDVINEVFDMAHPKDFDKITLSDLVQCGVGGTISSILIDCRGFHAYDNRESVDVSATSQ